MRPRPSKREEPSKAVAPPAAGPRVEHVVGRLGRDADPGVGAPRARRGRGDRARPAALAVLLVAHQAARARAGDDVRAQRVVAGGAVEEVGEPGAPHVGAVQRVLDEQRRAQRLGRPHAGDAQLADAARAALAGRRLGDVRDLHAQRAHAAQAQVQPVPPVAHGELAPVDGHAVHAALAVAVGHEVDVVDVARRREGHVEVVAIGGQRAVGQPRRRRVAVERGERTALGELGEAGREVGADRGHPAAHERDGLRVGPAARERVELRGVLGELLAGGHGPARVAAQARGDEDAPAVGVADHERRAARGLGAQRRPRRGRRRSAARGRSAARRRRRGRRSPAPSRRPPSRRRAAARAPCRRSARSSGGPAAAARRARASRPRPGRSAAARSARAGGPSARRTPAAEEAGTAPLRARSSSAPCTTAPTPMRSSSGRSWPGSGALLADQRVGRPLQVDGAQVGEGHDEARRHGPVGQGRAGSGRRSRPSRRRRRAGRAGPWRAGRAAACGRGRGRRRATPRARRGAARAGDPGRRRARAASTRAPPATAAPTSAAARRRGRSACTASAPRPARPSDTSGPAL